MPDTTTPVDDTAGLRHARLSNGVALAYDRAGQGTPLVFIHGAMGDWRSWDAQWPAFVPHFDCLRYSRRYSYPNPNRMPSPHHSALDEAQDLALLLDHLGFGRVVLVGSSYGSFTALALALAQPQRCLALALSEPAMLCYARFSESGRAVEQAFRRDVIAPANAAFRRGDDALAVQIMTGGIVGAARPVPAATMLRRQQNMLAMRMLALSTNEFPLLPPAQLAALAMPVLLLAGQNTPAIHAETFRNVCAAMPQAQVAWIEGAGHGTSGDNPARFNALVRAFLRAQGLGADGP